MHSPTQQREPDEQGKLEIARQMAHNTLRLPKKIHELDESEQYIRVGIGRTARYVRVSSKPDPKYEESRAKVAQIKSQMADDMNIPVPQNERWRLRFEFHEVWKRWAELKGVSAKYINLPIPAHLARD